MPANITPSVLKAVESHKKELSKKLNRIVLFDEALKDFLANCYEEFKREKIKKDNQDQLKEIDRHKWIESEKAQKDLFPNAMNDWVIKFAKQWRKERESLEKNGGIIVQIMITEPEGLHMRPSSTIAEIARKNDSHVYVHRVNKPLQYSSFILDGKEWLNVESLFTILQLEIIQGDIVEFIATGNNAKQTLDEITLAISNGCKG